MKTKEKIVTLSKTQIQTLDKLAVRFKRAGIELGKFLVSLDKQGGVQLSFFAKEYLSKKYSFGKCEMNTWMRIANGEIPQSLVEKVPCSKLAYMNSEVARSLAKDAHKIWSSEQQQVCVKYLKDFTKKEIADNITKSGITPVGTKVLDITRMVKAYDAFILNGALCVAVKNGNTKMHVHLNDGMVKKINKIVEEWKK